jgi:hypothetical protein
VWDSPKVPVGCRGASPHTMSSLPVVGQLSSAVQEEKIGGSEAGSLGCAEE